jgi:hypothetical protein
LNTQYSTNSFKIRVRAFNAAGWGEYSNISSSGTTTWSFGSMTDSGTCSPFTCSCGSCTCGSNTGTNSTATGTRTCYRWTRSGSTSGPLRNSNNTANCSTAYTNCTGGSCASCSGCGTTANVTAAGTYNGIQYISQASFVPGGNVLTRTTRGAGYECPCWEYFTITSCSQGGVTTYTVTSNGCATIEAICK